jgi:hypothetical protein
LCIGVPSMVWQDSLFSSRKRRIISTFLLPNACSKGPRLVQKRREGEPRLLEQAGNILCIGVPSMVRLDTLLSSRQRRIISTFFLPNACSKGPGLGQTRRRRTKAIGTRICSLIKPTESNPVMATCLMIISTRQLARVVIL